MFQIFVVSGWIDSGAFPGQGGSFINPPNMTSTFAFFQETLMRGVGVRVTGGGRVVAGVQSQRIFQEKKKERNRTKHSYLKQHRNSGDKIYFRSLFLVNQSLRSR